MIRKIMKYANGYKRYTLFATIMVFIAVLCSIIPYFFVYQIINPLITGTGISIEAAASRIVLILVFLTLNFALYLGGLSLSHIAAFNILANIRKYIQKKLEGLPLGIIQDKGVGRLKKLVVDDVESLELLLAHAIPEGFGNLLVPLCIFIALILIDWKLALLTIITVPIGLWAVSCMTKTGFDRMENYYRSAQVMNSTIIEYVNGMEVVKIFNKDGESYKRYQNDVKAYRDFTLDWYKACWPWMALYAGIFACPAFFSLPFGAMLVLHGYSTLSDLILVLCLSFGLGTPLLKAIRFIPSLAQVGRKLDEIENTVNEESLRCKNMPYSGQNNDIAFDNVSFSYGQDEVIKDVSFNIRQGEAVAFVGESGAGKSTLAKLIVHYYDVSKGHITIGGQDITDMSLEALNERISFVSQEQFLFNTSIKENIRIGKPGASDEEVLEAAEKAQCLDFISRFEYGMDTMAGDSGTKLSGGERQRISIARAILKDAPIVVLDEATAFADPENEEKMEKAISEVVRNKTLIVIAHRISSIKNADCIYVIENGRITGNGRHEDLLRTNETYSRLWKISQESIAWNVKNREVER